MEFVAQAQAMLAENVMYVGIGLVIALLIAGFVWYSMSRDSNKSHEVLENQARINVADMNLPNDSSLPDPVSPPAVNQEELEKQLASIGNMNVMETPDQE